MSLVPVDLGSPFHVGYHTRLRRGGLGRMATAISAVFVSLAALAFALLLGQAVMPTTGVVVLRLDPQPTQIEFTQSVSEWDGIDLIVPMATPAPRVKPIPSAVELALRPSVIETSSAQTQTTQYAFLEPTTSRPAASAPTQRHTQPTQPNNVHLAKAPQPGLSTATIQGPLPVIAPTGDTSYGAYGRPFNHADPRPRIVLMIGGLGLSQQTTTAAIDQLPGPVTLSFAPHGTGLQTAIDKAREAGHEIMLEVPMEPFGASDNQPSPYTLLAENTPPQNLSRLHWLMTRFSGYVGVTNYLGARFTADTAALQPVLRDIKARGLMILDDGSSKRSAIGTQARQIGLPAAKSTRTIDSVTSSEAIDETLLALEQAARRDGFVVAIGYAYPITVDRVALWAKTLEAKGFVLAPVSASLQFEKRTVAMIAPQE